MAYAGANGRLTAAPQELLSVAAAPFQKVAAVVSGGAFVVASVVILLAFPWISSHLVSWQDSAALYIEGGLRFIAETLAWAERNYTFAAKARLSDQLTQQISELGEKFAGTYLAAAALTAAAWPTIRWAGVRQPTRMWPS